MNFHLFADLILINHIMFITMSKHFMRTDQNLMCAHPNIIQQVLDQKPFRENKKVKKKHGTHFIAIKF